jgi:Fe-S-cluster containining protein
MQPPDVGKTEQKRIEEKGFKEFLEQPDENGIRWIRRKNDGSCWFLTKENKCAIYPLRPQVCRMEPFTITDFDYHKNRIEIALNFPFACCCIGTYDETTILPVAEIARAAQILVQKLLALTANDLRLPITDKRVRAETRSRLLRRSVEIADLQL